MLDSRRTGLVCPLDNDGTPRTGSTVARTVSDPERDGRAGAAWPGALSSTWLSGRHLASPGCDGSGWRPLHGASCRPVDRLVAWNGRDPQPLSSLATLFGTGTYERGSRPSFGHRKPRDLTTRKPSSTMLGYQRVGPIARTTATAGWFAGLPSRGRTRACRSCRHARPDLAPLSR